MGHYPWWLNSEHMQQLLHLLVDKLDAAEIRGTKTQSIALSEKTWPALYKAPYESEKEKLWQHLGEICDWGWIGVKPAKSIKVLSGYDMEPKLVVIDEVALRMAVNRPERVKRASERWRAAVDRHLDATQAVKSIVGEYCIDMPDHAMAEVVQQLNVLPSLTNKPMLLREVSAQLFWGMSKVLDKRQGMVAAIVGMDECPFAESPIQLHVYLPPTGYHSILFIENAMSFEQALRSTSRTLDGLALVFASGFKGSAQRLRNPDGCSLFYSSSGALGGDTKVAFEAWLFGRENVPAFFWGDLDYSGMRILAAMRSIFTNIQAWVPGYGPMLEKLLSGGGHSPEAAEKKGQRSIESTGCPYADTQLIPILAREKRFLDQELFAK